MSAAIAIFVKTPGLSPLKTRLLASLAKHWPDPETWVRDFYLRSAQCVAEAALASGAAVYWALGEKEGASFHAWQALPQLLQVPAPNASQAVGLGQRMHHVMAQLIERHGAGILLGADTPQVDAAELACMVEYLNADQPCQLIGPATDGGFWSYGSNRAAPLSWWESVPYSVSTTAAQFCQRFNPLCPLHTQSSHTDVDAAQDLSACLTALQALQKPSPAQRSLIARLSADLTSLD
jgi:uncharacterized protein